MRKDWKAAGPVLCYLIGTAVRPTFSLTSSPQIISTYLHYSKKSTVTAYKRRTGISTVIARFSSQAPLNMSTDAIQNNVGFNDIAGPKDSGSDDPMTTWRERIKVSSNRSRKVRGGNYVQIATVDPETLEPRCRTVVFRGFLKQDGKETDLMKMITDKRSSKYSEVTNKPINENTKSSSSCEMVWWFGKSSEQYRIRGQLQFIGGEEKDASLVTARKEQWGNLSDPAREQFFWKEPGVPFVSQSNVPEGGRDTDGKVLTPPDNFLLMLLSPNRCDYLRLGDNYRQIDIINGKNWDAQQVTP